LFGQVMPDSDGHASVPATGLTRIINAAGYSWAGFCAAMRHEAAFRQELFLFVIMAPLGYWFGDGAIERVLLIGSLFVVLIVELLNSGIEAVVDRIGSEHHILSGRAKDLGSAAVFLSLALVVLTWVLILF
jgi:diacylglycerol kinase (ATP)